VSLESSLLARGLVRRIRSGAPSCQDSLGPRLRPFHRHRSARSGFLRSLDRGPSAGNSGLESSAKFLAPPAAVVAGCAPGRRRWLERFRPSHRQGVFPRRSCVPWAWAAPGGLKASIQRRSEAYQRDALVFSWGVHRQGRPVRRRDGWSTSVLKCRFGGRGYALQAGGPVHTPAGLRYRTIPRRRCGPRLTIPHRGPECGSESESNRHSRAGQT